MVLSSHVQGYGCQYMGLMAAGPATHGAASSAHELYSLSAGLGPFEQSLEHVFLGSGPVAGDDHLLCGNIRVHLGNTFCGEDVRTRSKRVMDVMEGALDS